MRSISYRWVVLTVVLGLAVAGSAFTQVRPIFRPPVRPPAVRPKPPRFPHVIPPPHGTPHSNKPGTHPWPGNQPAMRVESPEERQRRVRNQVLAVIKGQPEQALIILGQQGSILPDRVALARQAVHGLAEQVEKSNNAWAALGRVRRARAHAAPISKDVDRFLLALDSFLQRHGSAASVTTVLALVDKGQWQQAGGFAGKQLKGATVNANLPIGMFAPHRGGLAGLPDQPDPSYLPAEVKTAFEEIITLSKQAAGLDGLQTALKEADRPDLMAKALRGADNCHGCHSSSLPVSLQEAVRGLRALADLRTAAESSTHPDLTALKQWLADLPFAGVDESLALTLQQDLAVKYFLDGYPVEARALLPANGSAGHAQKLLEDMRVLLLGQGQVATWPGQRALAALPQRTAPGLRHLLPEANAGPALAQLRAAVPAAPAPLEELIRRQGPQTQRVAEEHKKARATFDLRNAEARNNLQALHRRYQPGPKDAEREATLLTDLKNQLKRPDLLPAERILALEWRRQGKHVADIAKILAETSPPPPKAPMAGK